MDPIRLLGLLSEVAIFIPPPWGPIIASLGRVLPLVEQGFEVLVAINKADPTLLPQIEAAAKQVFGVDLQAGNTQLMAKLIFSPHQMTSAERMTAEQVAIDFQAGGRS